VIVGKLLESKDADWGFDAQTGNSRPVKAGIIDPAKVVRCALQDASSVAGLLITTEAMVADKPEPKSDGPAGGMPDMGGMRRRSVPPFLCPRVTAAPHSVVPAFLEPRTRGTRRRSIRPPATPRRPTAPLRSRASRPPLPGPSTGNAP
jgi:hypothetical protein